MSLEDQLRLMENGLLNSKEGEISEHLSHFGFIPTKIDIGLEKVRTTRDLHSRQQQEHGEQISSTALFNKLKKSAEKRLGTTWKIAKIAVSDSGVKRTLGINHARKFSNNGFLQQFDTLYRNITPGVIKDLAEYGYSAAKIKEECEIFEEVVRAHKKKDDETGEAQMATIHRDESVDDLHHWMRKYYKVSKLALADHPQLLERIGIRYRK